MHKSIVASREHRNRENQRRTHNIRKRQAQGFVRACGLEPAFTPSHSDGPREVRRAKIRPQLRAKRFIKNLMHIAGTV